MTIARAGLLAIAVAALAFVFACDAPEVDPRAAEAAVTVAAYETTTCSTRAVRALARQVTDEVRCLLPGALVEIAEQDGIDFTSGAVVPYLSPDARADLLAVAAAAVAGGRVVRLSSVYRTVVQQYLVRRWFELGRCDVAAAARPGRSNHESGRAVDLAEPDLWIDAMAAHGWMHDVPGDDVHFDHPATADHRGADVLAFQRLWNRNQPDDPIDEDGEYSDATAARIARAPAAGFAIGASCVDDEGL